MRFWTLLLLLGCAGAESSDLGTSADAGVPDSGPMIDAGMIMLSCGAQTCDGFAEYCKIEPVGPCVAIDAGACAAGEEACQSGGVSGCTPERTRSCVALPANCDSCGCLIASAPCGPTPMQVDCLAVSGVTVECPY